MWSFSSQWLPVLWLWSVSQVVPWCLQNAAVQEGAWHDTSLSVYILVMLPTVVVDKAKGP